uniref:Mab-21 domain-containing protein n=1 Tax=Panagrellus redivivus TaxID=6233 RepID=A0A7E4V5M9_PANRE
MLSSNTATLAQINAFYAEKVQARRADVHKTVRLVAKIIQDLLKDVEHQEPRFISTLTENNLGRFDGLQVISPHEFEVILYLNQMGVFNFVDDGSVQGCAALKLSDGRKRSMSLWVEFITASGYLSARKIRSRFHTLIVQALERSQYRDIVVLLADTTDVRLRIHDTYVVQITCSFRCSGIWPRSANQWPNMANTEWPNPLVVNEVKNEGFDLLSKEVPVPVQAQNNQAPGNSKQHVASTMDGDAWAMSMFSAENLLLAHSNRQKALSILKTLRDRHLDYEGSPVTNYILKTLILYECEKHQQEHEWFDINLGDRVIGVLLQLVSCLQCRKCPNYFLPQMDLLKGKPPVVLDHSARACWALVRRMILDSRALETL